MHFCQYVFFHEQRESPAAVQGVQVVDQSKMHGDSYSCEIFARVDNPNMYIMIDRWSRSLKKAVKVPLNSKISWSLILERMRLTFRYISLALRENMVKVKGFV